MCESTTLHPCLHSCTCPCSCIDIPHVAGYRVVGSGKSLRIECRIPGADVNPYLAFAASLASGLAGIEQKLSPPEMFQGDIYQVRHKRTQQHAGGATHGSWVLRSLSSVHVVFMYSGWYTTRLYVLMT